MYDLVLVDSAPLPPHERTWRHPSELGPTRSDVDTGSRSHVGVLAAGALAVFAVAALVVVVTPRPAAGPLSISATTSPVVRVLSPDPAPFQATLPARPTVRLVSSFTAYPHSIASASVADVDGTSVADEEPSASAAVLVRTDKVTYRLKWSQVPMLSAPDGTVVYDLDGQVVGRFIGGELQTLVGAD